MTGKIPELLKLEHEELYAELVRATKAGGKTGERAKALTKVLHDHFVKEEEFALPPIGLMAALARGKVDQEMRSVFAMTDRLKAELPKMLQQHRAIISELKKLIATAKREKKAEHARFAEKLTRHAKTEEKVLYPAAMLIGEYLSLKLGRAQFEGYC
jgi:hemerythrin superfamily protein